MVPMMFKNECWAAPSTFSALCPLLLDGYRTTTKCSQSARTKKHCSTPFSLSYVARRAENLPFFPPHDLPKLDGCIMKKVYRVQTTLESNASNQEQYRKISGDQFC